MSVNQSLIMIVLIVDNVAEVFFNYCIDVRNFLLLIHNSESSGGFHVLFWGILVEFILLLSWGLEKVSQ